MHLQSILLPVLPLVASAIDVSFYVSPSQILPNPRAALPATTHATLTTFKKDIRTAPLSTVNTFVFHNVTPGSYLVDFHTRTHAFAPVRLDVTIMVEDEKAEGEPQAVIKAWETYRGNDWDNKGEAAPLTSLGFEVRVVGAKNFFVERQSFSIMTILKNPMILLGLVSMVLFIGMPKLVDNMDPEMRAEWEESQKSNPVNALLGGGGGNSPDVAGYLSGAGKKGKK